MSDARQRGVIRGIILTLLIGFMCFWFLQGFWMAIKITVALMIVSLLFAGLMILTYETNTVLEWLGNLSLRGLHRKVRNNASN